MTDLNKTDQPEASNAVASPVDAIVSSAETDWGQMFKVVASKFDEIAVIAAEAREYNMAQRFGNSANTIRQAAKVIDDLTSESDDKERNKAKQSAIKTAEAQLL
jgi:hypothetical protein